MGAAEETMCECYRGSIVVMKVFWRQLCVSDLFVLTWARVRRIRRGSISSEQLMCAHMVARCLETIDVCIWRMLVLIFCRSECVGSVGMVVV